MSQTGVNRLGMLPIGDQPCGVAVAQVVVVLTSDAVNAHPAGSSSWALIESGTMSGEGVSV